MRRRDRRRRPGAPLRHRPLAHPGRGDVPALRLLPRLQPARGAVDDVPHPGGGRQRPAPGDVHRAHAGPRGGHPVQLHVRAARRDDGLLRQRACRPCRSRWRGARRRAACASSPSPRWPSRMSGEPDPARGRAAARRGGPGHRPVHATRRRDVSHRRARHAGRPGLHARRRGHRQLASRSAWRSCSRSAAPCRRSSRAPRSSEASAHGRSSTEPTPSTHGASPVPSTSNEEVTDARR